MSSPTAIDTCQHLSDHPEGEIRFGFCAPDNRLTSLNIPAEGAYGKSDPTLSFDVEFDQDHPDRIAISLMDLDEDGFIRTVHRTVQFPARLLAELLSRRKATAEEAREWRAPGTEE
jgi:hypothetical protein